MKSWCRLHVVLLVLGLGSPAAADTTTLIQRLDIHPWSSGQKPLTMEAVVTPGGWQFLAFDLQRPATTDVEVGRWYPLGRTGLSLGGYLAYWPARQKLFAMPWLHCARPLLGGTLTADLAYYQPVNGGPRITFSDRVKLQWRAGSFSVGPAASFWQVDAGPWSGQMRLAIGHPLQQWGIAEIDCQPVSLWGGIPRIRFNLISFIR